MKAISMPIADRVSASIETQNLEIVNKLFAKSVVRHTIGEAAKSIPKRRFEEEAP
jgi:hypothetical protein